MELRYYQEAAKQAAYFFLEHEEGNPCVVMPTGSGKTPLIAEICKDAVLKWNSRVAILSHVKELLEQSVEKLSLVAPELESHIGIYSAGLNSRDTEHKIIVAGIQSIVNRASELGKFDLVLIDECHLIPENGEGRYLTFLNEAKIINPNLRIVGLTATPFRTTSGWICKEENILNKICYEVSISELIEQKFLSKIVSKGSRVEIDTSNIKVLCGEFDQAEMDEAFSDEEIVSGVTKEILEYGRSRKSCLVFATSLWHANKLQEEFVKRGETSVECIFGNTKSILRKSILDDFKVGKLKYLINCNVLTTGFDAPNIDLVAIARPTMSPGLYYQMCGRGFRIHPEKENCIVLDFGGNVYRHGPVDALTIINRKEKEKGEEEEPTKICESCECVNKITANKCEECGEPFFKKCPECLSIVVQSAKVCPEEDCGYVFEEEKPNRFLGDIKPSGAAILLNDRPKEVHEVAKVTYAVHTKSGADEDAPKTFRVNYHIGFAQIFSEWICVEHTGYARKKAELWWNKRCDFPPCPDSASEALLLAESGCLVEAKTITVRLGKSGYNEILSYELKEHSSLFDIE